MPAKKTPADASSLFQPLPPGTPPALFVIPSTMLPGLTGGERAIAAQNPALSIVDPAAASQLISNLSAAPGAYGVPTTPAAKPTPSAGPGDLLPGAPPPAAPNASPEVSSRVRAAMDALELERIADQRDDLRHSRDTKRRQRGEEEVARRRAVAAQQQEGAARAKAASAEERARGRGVGRSITTQEREAMLERTRNAMSRR